MQYSHKRWKLKQIRSHQNLQPTSLSFDTIICEWKTLIFSGKFRIQMYKYHESFWQWFVQCFMCCVWIWSDLDEFGIIGLHAKPEDVFNELNALDKVYETVSERFGVSVSNTTDSRWKVKCICIFLKSQVNIGVDRFTVIFKCHLWSVYIDFSNAPLSVTHL